MKIIKDIKGGRLRLTKTTLTEVTGTLIPGKKWSVRLVDLNGGMVPLFRKANKDDWQYSSSTRVQPTIRGEAFHSPRDLRIGCRTFNVKTYEVIAKAIREAK